MIPCLVVNKQNNEAHSSENRRLKYVFQTLQSGTDVLQPK